MLAKSLRLIWRQMNVQFRLRALSGYSMILLIIQPAIFSGVGFILARVAGKQAPDLIYTIIGGGFMGLWSSILFTSFYDITNDRVEGTLELIVGSPTSLTKILAIRTLTNVLTGMISLSCSFLIALAFFGYKFNVENLPAAVVSVLIIMLTFWCLGLFLANFHAWSRVSGTAINYLELPIAVVCGFMFPVSILPAWLSPFSAILPMRWAIAAMNQSISASPGSDPIWWGWSIALALSLVYYLLAHWMAIKIHDKIRVSGELSSI